MKKVMVFGVFDGVHEGHKAFFKEAKSHGDYLVAVVAQDHIVERLKGRLPSFDFGKRVDDLQKEDAVDEVVIGDSELGSYGVVMKSRPDVIAFGYDQKNLKEDLESNYKKFDWKPRVVMMNAYEPNKYHSSKLRGL